jgi:hypothetical protein
MEIGKIIRTLVLSFVFGGLTSIVAQFFAIFWGSILGETIFVTLLSLICLGIVGTLLVIIGIYGKLEELSGFGIGFSFGGFCATLASIFVGTKANGGSSSDALKAALKVAGFVICSGITTSILVAALAVFAKKGGI